MLFAPASAAPPVQLTVPLPLQIQDKTDVADLKTKSRPRTTNSTDIQKDLKDLTELLKGRKDKDGFPIETSPGLIAELKKFTDRLARVEEDLNKMKGQTVAPPGNAERDSRGSADREGDDTGGERIPVQISIVVNGTSYRVAPTKSLDVDVAGGRVHLSTCSSPARPPTKSVIKEKETVTLRIK